MDFHANRKLVILVAFAFHVIVLVWQVVGVVRAAESHFAERGNMALVWGAQLGCVVMFLLSAVYALGAAQMTLRTSEPVDVLAQMNVEHARQYTLEISDNERAVYIDGMIDLGISRAVKSYLLQYPDIEVMVLNSSGGNIYEARGLARLLAENNLRAHVDYACASACTIAFSGGTVRTADEHARFGFHQYRIDADYTIIATDIEKEQSRDQQRLLGAGVNPQFVDKVFSQPSASMWWPDRKELLIAGFLHDNGFDAGLH